VVLAAELVEALGPETAVEGLVLLLGGHHDEAIPRLAANSVSSAR